MSNAEASAAIFAFILTCPMAVVAFAVLTLWAMERVRRTKAKKELPE